MGKEEDLLKAVKNKDIKKVQKLLSSTSMKRKGEEATWQNLQDTGHKIRQHLHHINVNAQEPDTGSTPLLLAVLAGLRDVAEMLIFYSANVNAQDCKGNTALHLAVFSGRADLITLLLANEADVNSVNDDLNAPLHIACQHSVKPQIILKLLQAGANVWLTNKDDHTGLDMAAMFNKKAVVTMLMEHCPPLRAHQCGLVEAAMRDNVDVVETLLDFGVDPDRPDTPRASTALCEATRFCRVRSAEMLLAFGADADKQNLKKETPRSLSKDLPAALQKAFESLFKEYSGRQSRIPKHLAQRESQLTESFKLKCLKNYPVMASQQGWTRNTRQYCSTCTQANSNLHVLDDKPTTFWVIPEPHNAWTTLDLGSPHVVTGVTVVGWDSAQMVRNFELQAADSVEGPWSTFTSHNCQRVGSTNPRDPGVEQTFTGFTVKVQFLRLYIFDNHGGSSINFQGIRLHGADCRIFDLLESCQLRHLADDFVEKGVNAYQKLIDSSEAEIASIVRDPVEASQIQQVVRAERRKVYPMTALQWLVSPPSSGQSNQDLPDFSVQSSPGVTEQVEVRVEGAELKGVTCVLLCPSGEGAPSMAVFSGIQVKTVGRFTVRVHGLTSPVMVEATEQIEICQGRKNSSEISAAFDEIESMLSSMQDML